MTNFKQILDIKSPLRHLIAIWKWENSDANHLSINPLPYRMPFWFLSPYISLCLCSVCFNFYISDNIIALNIRWLGTKNSSATLSNSECNSSCKHFLLFCTDLSKNFTLLTYLWFKRLFRFQFRPDLRVLTGFYYCKTNNPASPTIVTNANMHNSKLIVFVVVSCCYW